MNLIDTEFWRGKHVFLTGHTGFKGSWLSIWLQLMGAKLYGYALNPPTNPSLFTEANVGKGMSSIIGDIRNFQSLKEALENSKAEIVIHMAAQPLVRFSYMEPLLTYSTNVMGSVHLFEAIRQTGSVRAVVNVTTDKCYENKEWIWGYRENEELGGYDPYSNSKACSELVTSAYRQSFFQQNNIALASARAGNVIGGGDWALDRLIPDTLSALEQNKPVIIRSPSAIRPWQHVLEPLAGYLMLAQQLYENGSVFAEAWNFGPQQEDAKSVEWIVDELVKKWGNGASWELDSSEKVHEATYLKLDISKAKDQLRWKPQWTLLEALDMIVKWHKKWLNHEDMRMVCIDQIQSYAAKNAK
jgi:CDP-glucose 4,6-dehydratase